MNEKAKLRVPLRRCLNTCSFHSVDELLMFVNNSFLQILLIFCIVIILYIVYICRFQTYSTSYCYSDKLLDSWNVHM